MYLKLSNKTFIFLLGFFLFFFFSSALGKGEIDLQKVEKLIFLKCNKERKRYQLPMYKYNTNLERLARYHSSNMIKHDFFSHTDHLRMSPQKRMIRLYPQIIGAVGENIAINYGFSEEEIAVNLVNAWMRSPGHRANILSKAYYTLGNGVVAQSDRNQANIDSYYATQNFGDIIAIYEGKFPILVKNKSEINLPFLFVGGFPKNRLYIYTHYPNKNYKHYVKAEQGSYRYYLGGAPYTPIWREENHFDIQLVFDKGLGSYSINMGSYGKFYPDGLMIEASQ